MAQGYPRDFAEATFIEDTEDAAQQVEELTAKAKASGAEKVKAKKKPANYSMDGAAKKRAPRKPNEEKRMIVEWLKAMLEANTEQVEVTNPEQKVDFHIGANHYTVQLTLHRPPKADKK
jgi:malate/lactate dehydrogenase